MSSIINIGYIFDGVTFRIPIDVDCDDVIICLAKVCPAGTSWGGDVVYEVCDAKCRTGRDICAIADVNDNEAPAKECIKVLMTIVKK